LPAQWPQRTGAHKACKSPRVGAPRIGRPHGLGTPWTGGTQGLGASMGWGPQRVSGRVYESKPIITVVFCFFGVFFVQRMQFFLHTLNSRNGLPYLGNPPTSGGLPARLTRFSLGTPGVRGPKGTEAPKAQGPPWLGGPKAGEFPRLASLES
jgi:hypothetical protein